MACKVHSNPFFLLIILSLFPALGFSQDKPGWKVIWSDEFTSPTLDGSKWTMTEEAANTNSELEYYSKSPKNLFIEEGSLVLRALKEYVGGRNYTSAKLTT